jgi:hypothetical protein
MVTEIQLFQTGCCSVLVCIVSLYSVLFSLYSVLVFSLYNCMKSEFYQIKGDTREELLAGILAADKEA